MAQGSRAGLVPARPDRAGGHAPTNPLPLLRGERLSQPAGTGEGLVPNNPGSYMMDQGRSLHRIEDRVTSFERSGSRLASAATLGIHANRINLQIPGSRAHVTVAPQPTFYCRMEPGKEEVLDLILTQVTVVRDRRQFEAGAQGMWRSSKGVSVRHQLDFDAHEVEPGVYRVVLMHELETGQYAFYMLRGMEYASVHAGKSFVFDFQVE